MASLTCPESPEMSRFGASLCPESPTPPYRGVGFRDGTGTGGCVASNPGHGADNATGSAIGARLSCWDCACLSTVSSDGSRFPSCRRGHRIVWRRSATRTWPGRSDGKHCGERA